MFGRLSAQGRARARVCASSSLQSLLTPPARRAARVNRFDGLLIETFKIGPPDKYPKRKLIQDGGANVLRVGRASSASVAATEFLVVRRHQTPRTRLSRPFSAG
jgi:hypothetical protein